MPVDRRDLDARLTAATPADTVRGLIFNAIFDTLDEHLGPDAVKACDLVKKGHRTDFFSYPVADFLRIAATAADALEPKVGSLERAWFDMGYRAVSNVFGSTLGATLLALAQNNIKTFLSQAPNAYKATVSYGERTVEWRTPRHALLHFSRDFLVVPYHVGVLTAAVEALGGKDVAVDGKVTAPLAATYEVRWS